MDKFFRGPDLVPENGKVTGPLSGNGEFFTTGPLGKTYVEGSKVCVGSTEKQWSDEFYPYEKIL